MILSDYETKLDLLNNQAIAKTMVLYKSSDAENKVGAGDNQDDSYRQATA